MVHARRRDLGGLDVRHPLPEVRQRRVLRGGSRGLDGPRKRDRVVCVFDEVVRAIDHVVVRLVEVDFLVDDRRVALAYAAGVPLHGLGERLHEGLRELQKREELFGFDLGVDAVLHGFIRS